MRRVESWQRPLALLLAGSLFLVYGPLYGQVGVRLIYPVETSVEASTEALQQARSSLLEARLAVDDALYEVERALGLLAGETPTFPEPAPAPPSQASTSGNALGSLQNRIQAQVSRTTGELRTLFADLPAALTHLSTRLAELSARRAVVAGDATPPTPEVVVVPTRIDKPVEPAEWVSTPASQATEDGSVAFSVDSDLLFFPVSIPLAHDEIIDPVVLPAPPETEELPATPADAELPPFDATVIRPEGLRLEESKSTSRR